MAVFVAGRPYQALALSPLTSTLQDLKENETETLCPQIRFQKTAIRDFSELETTLVCGTPSPDLKSWSHVPLTQSRLFLRSFLEKRGFHQPSFHEVNDVLLVDPGPRAMVAAVGFEGVPSDMEMSRRWNLLGQPLQPATLDEIEEWTRTQLRINGYPCGQVEVRADPETHQVLVQLTPRHKKTILNIDEKLDGTLEEGTLSRYYAFAPGHTYNLERINLTRTRINNDGIVQNVFFDVNCNDKNQPDSGVTLHESIVAGPTNLIKAGVGGNLEQGPELRASWQKNRLDKRGSSVLLSSNDSLRQQQMQGILKQYWFQKWPRLFTQPQVTLQFEKEPFYSSRDLLAHYYLGYQWDTSAEALALMMGPSWRTSWANRAGLSSNNRIIAIETHARLTSHDYETHIGSPRKGTQIQADVVSSDPDFNSDIRAQQIVVRGHWLYNYLRFDPPRFILGLRWNFGTTIVPAQYLDRLPPDFLFYLGGSQDVRGFDRKSLPLDGYGRLTTGYLGSELRWYKLLFHYADPFILGDVARLGGRSFRLENETYFAYGLGVRWESPIGVFRLYAARGEVAGRSEDLPKIDPVLRFGLSYGEEF